MMSPKGKRLKMPQPIDDGTPEEVASALLRSKPRKDSEWKYIKERKASEAKRKARKQSAEKGEHYDKGK